MTEILIFLIHCLQIGTMHLSSRLRVKCALKFLRLLWDKKRNFLFIKFGESLRIVDEIYELWVTNEMVYKCGWNNKLLIAELYNQKHNNYVVENGEALNP